MDFFAEPAEEGMEFMNHDADSDDLRSHLNSRAGLNRDVEDPAQDPVNIIHEVPVYPHVATPVPYPYVINPMGIPDPAYQWWQHTPQYYPPPAYQFQPPPHVYPQPSYAPWPNASTIPQMGAPTSDPELRRSQSERRPPRARHESSTQLRGPQPDVRNRPPSPPADSPPRRSAFERLRPSARERPIADGPCDLGSTIKVRGDRSAQCELEDPRSGTASTPAELEELAYGFGPGSETSSGMISSIEARHRPQHVHGKEMRQGSHSLSSSPWSQPPPSRPPRLYAPKRRSAPLDPRSLSPSQLTIASEDRLLASPACGLLSPLAECVENRRGTRGARAFLPLRRGDDLRVGRRDSFLPFPPERARHLQVGPRSFGRCDYRRSRGHVGTPGCSEGVNDRFKAAESDLLPDPLGTRRCRKAFVQNHSSAKEYQHVKG
nr:uncharacterized protein LOC109155647 [Ipomoea batatas]